MEFAKPPCLAATLAKAVTLDDKTPRSWRPPEQPHLKLLVERSLRGPRCPIRPSCVSVYTAGRFVLLNEAQCESPQEAEVFGSVVFANPALVFVECHVQNPVKRVLDAPVGSHRRGKLFYLRFATRNEMADFRSSRGEPDRWAR